jgi:hypothetical protein
LTISIEFLFAASSPVPKEENPLEQQQQPTEPLQTSLMEPNRVPPSAVLAARQRLAAFLVSISILKKTK